MSVCSKDWSKRMRSCKQGMHEDGRVMAVHALQLCACCACLAQIEVNITEAMAEDEEESSDDHSKTLPLVLSLPVLV